MPEGLTPASALGAKVCKARYIEVQAQANFQACQIFGSAVSSPGDQNRCQVPWQELPDTKFVNADVLEQLLHGLLLDVQHLVSGAHEALRPAAAGGVTPVRRRRYQAADRRLTIQSAADLG